MSEKIDTDTTVTEISIPKEKLDTIQKISSSKNSWHIKKDQLLARIVFRPLCCVCDQVSTPLYRVRYSYPDYVRFEVYCTTHLESVYQNTKDKTNEEIAESYGCQIGEIRPTIREPWD